MQVWAAEKAEADHKQPEEEGGGRALLVRITARHSRLVLGGGSSARSMHGARQLAGGVQTGSARPRIAYKAGRMWGLEQARLTQHHPPQPRSKALYPAPGGGGGGGGGALPPPPPPPHPLYRPRTTGGASGSTGP